MNIQQERLLSLIDFAQQSARLRTNPAPSVDTHGVFALFEHELQGLPGTRLNVNDTEAEEVWLTIERLQETKPPEIANKILLPWVQMTQSPKEEPRLRQATDGESLIAAGTHSSATSVPEPGKPAIAPGAVVTLVNYDKFAEVKDQFTQYLDKKWRPWAEEERLRRRTIGLYAKLFTLKQQLEGAIVEAQLELVWGVGLGVWEYNGANVSYPLVESLVEVSLNPVTAALEVRPRDIDVRIQLDWYVSVDNPGVANLEKAAREFFAHAERTFSPFDHGSFEPLLRTAATNLNANGTYWPDHVSQDDRSLPNPEKELKVTDTWVFFARPRTTSLFLQDLEKLKARIEDAEAFPPAVAAIVTDPEISNPVVDLPVFRGVSTSYHSESRANGAKDLHFPKPYNDEQVRIVQLLEIYDGVVVQGPPGTGKTHTIANVICHYLAEGKRVLVTSMKDPALGVLQEQLPDEIRPLAIPLLASERDGMKQFEHSIRRIASEVQSLDRAAVDRSIRHLTETIDFLHEKLAVIDRRTAEWAKRNLTKIHVDNEDIDPLDAARDVLGSAGQVDWIQDSLGIGPEFAPRFSDADIVRLRDARRVLGRDIDYLDASCAVAGELPDARELLEVHQDLSRLEKLKQSVERGEVQALADSSQETLARAQVLLDRIQELRDQRDVVAQAQRPWTVAMYERLRHGKDRQLLCTVEALGSELEQSVEERKAFLERPVTAPIGSELDLDLIGGVINLADGRRPFGLLGLFGHLAQKAKLSEIRVLGATPRDAESWNHVSKYLSLSKRLRELAMRWNALAGELQLEEVSEDTIEGAVAAQRAYDVYLSVKRVVQREAEVCAEAVDVFPHWPVIRTAAYNRQHLDDLERTLSHHITKGRLAKVWALRDRYQRTIDGRTGRVTEELRRFLSQTLGNPMVDDVSLQGEWLALIAELSRVLSIEPYLATVREICASIRASGAPQYADALTQPIAGAVDHLLPENWRQCWRLRRLATYLDSIDAQYELKQLANDRNEIQSDLSRTYGDIVVKRAWLKLAENATPNVRAALEAYLTAILRIRKGTGKRAVRYRQDARHAAAQANDAVPCWIMPHYRVSESLPAELGCFDLVVIDEASQSDLTALPALLRARKMLIVGDDKQVSPAGIGLEEEKILSLMGRFLQNQVPLYKAQMSPERSIYDLSKVVFARSAVMLKEHFRCVRPIIEYSKREYYSHELRPLRVPRASERLDPPLVDVLVEAGHRTGDVNKPEARFIVDEIKILVADPKTAGRSIGVVSLLGDKQALLVWVRIYLTQQASGPTL